MDFFFHAKDIFHGSGFFDQRKPEWDSDEKRWPVLLDLAQIIEDLTLPVVAGTYRKETFGGGILKEETKLFQHNMIQDIAALDCLLWADRWLAAFAPDELATVVHEDGTAAKKLIKATVRVARSEEQMRKWGIREGSGAELGLPLKRIIDTVHFAEKGDASPLQIADLCAFILGRAMKEMPVPIGVFQTIFTHLKWVMENSGKGDEAKRALDALAEPVAAEPSS